MSQGKHKRIGLGMSQGKHKRIGLGMSLGKTLVGMSLGETGVGGLGIGAGKALEVVCEGAFENGLGMSLTKHLRMVWERTLGKHMRVVWEREDIHQFHVNKLIRLASLCDSSHKIIHSVLCQNGSLH